MPDRIVEKIGEDFFDHRVGKKFDAPGVSGHVYIIRDRQPGQQHVQFLPLRFLCPKLRIDAGELYVVPDCHCGLLYLAIVCAGGGIPGFLPGKFEVCQDDGYLVEDAV